MKENLETKRLFLVGGSGGVGKTTLAAALGVELARRGYRTVVLTVDPARRLAQSLGLSNFTNDLQPVDLTGVEPLAGKTGTLHASMLDTQRYFDKIIERFARSEAQKQKLMAHPLYRTTVDTLGGTHEYAAMERLLEFSLDARFDKVVVDTPPTQNAVDLLTAPQRLADFLDGSVLAWFRDAGNPIQKLFRSGTRVAMKVLQKVMGGEFFASLSSFLEDLEGMESGFRDRNHEVMRLLRGEATGFLLVSYPSEVRFEESRAFADTLREKGIALSALFLNRLEPPPPTAGIPAGLEPLSLFLKEAFDVENHWVQRFTEAFSAVPVRRLTRRDADLHQLGALSSLGRELLE